MPFAYNFRTKQHIFWNRTPQRMSFVSSVAIKKEHFWVVADNRAELQLEHRTSLRTILLSCWSRRMLSKVPHSPPLMFWQLPHRAWHPLGTEDRAAPKPKLAHLTWHERGNTDLGKKEKCCRCFKYPQIMESLKTVRPLMFRMKLGCAE